MGDPVGAVQRPVERDGPARRVGPRGLLGDRTAARGPDRRPSQRRGDAAVARRPARGRPAVGGPPPARLLRAATRGRERARAAPPTLAPGTSAALRRSTPAPSGVITASCVRQTI